jgi:hypothetical protein
MYFRNSFQKPKFYLVIPFWDSAFERTTGGFLWSTKSEDESSFLDFGICGAGSEDPMN